MRGAKAKALRREARALTQGGPGVELLQHNRTKVIFHSLKSTRGMYQRLKRIATKGR